MHCLLALAPVAGVVVLHVILESLSAQGVRWDVEVLGDRYEDRGLVFATDTGGPVNPSNLRKRSFAPLLEKASLPRVRFHDLRHTCATLLLSKGTHPKVVQKLLGHATVAITLDTYSHIVPGMGDQSARAMEDTLS